MGVTTETMEVSRETMEVSRETVDMEWMEILRRIKIKMRKWRKWSWTKPVCTTTEVRTATAVAGRSTNVQTSIDQVMSAGVSIPKSNTCNWEDGLFRVLNTIWLSMIMIIYIHLRLSKFIALINYNYQNLLHWLIVLISDQKYLTFVSSRNGEWCRPDAD